MARRREVILVGLLAAAGLLSACSNTSSSSGTTSVPPTSPMTTTSSTAPVPSTSSTTSPTQVQNVTVTQAVRQELIAAGATYNHVTPADYTGLAQGRTFLAYDPSTQTSWAGAQLVPSPSSTQAQVAAQDDGSYLLFSKSAGGTWKVIALTGMSDIGGSPHCPSGGPPPGVVAVWGWTPGSCMAPQTAG